MGTVDVILRDKRLNKTKLKIDPYYLGIFDTIASNSRSQGSFIN